MENLLTFFVASASLASSQIVVFFLALAVLLGLATILGELARKLGQPAIFGEILAGILLGPTVLGMLSPDMFSWIFPASGPTRVSLDGFITISAALFLFAVGLEVDLGSVWKQGKEAISVSITGIVCPFVIGLCLALFWPKFFGIGDIDLYLPFVIFFGIALSISALPVIAKILMDINLAKSDMGMLVLASAMLNDLVGWIGFAIVLALIPQTTGSHAVTFSIGAKIGLTLAFLLIMLTFGRLFTHKALPYVQAHWSWPGGVIASVFVFALLCAAGTEFIGVHAIFGAFIAGVAMGDSYHLSDRTRDTIHQFVTNVFSPIFFASLALRIDFVSAFSLSLVLIVLFVAVTGKILGCFTGARLARMSKRESWALSFGMSSQGAVGIILGQLALQAGLITNKLFVAIIIMALVTSLMAGPLMQKALRLKTKRRLSRYLSDKGILIRPEPKSVEDLVGKMSQTAEKITGISAQKIKAAVLKREQIMHTGLPGGLAVPHARLRELKKPHALIACMQHGVDFHAPDHLPARIVCLILTPEDNHDAQIELLNLFARTFDDPDVKEQALRAKTSTELLAALNRSQSSEAEAVTA